MRVLVTLLLLCFAATASAAPKLLVMRADSSTDWETRTRIESLVMGLARNVDRGVGQSETSFKAVADMVGCTGDFATCKGDVIETLAIDEIVVITIAPAPSGKIKVTVRRASKSAATREATAVVDKDDDKAIVAAVGPLFGATRVVDAPGSRAKASSPAPPPPKGNVSFGGGAVVDNEAPPPAHRESAPSRPPEPARHDEPAHEEAPPPPAPEPAHHATTSTASVSPEPTVTGAPDNRVEDAPRRGSPAAIGMIAGGGVLAVVGVVLWKKASDIEDEIRRAPNRTRADVDHLLDLQDRGDRYALWGNITFVGGVVVAGVGGYLYWRSRRASHASVTALVFDHGGGLALTLEGR